VHRSRGEGGDRAADDGRQVRHQDLLPKREDGGCGQEAEAAVSPRQDRCAFESSQIHFFLKRRKERKKEKSVLQFCLACVRADEPDGLHGHEVVGEGGAAQHAGGRVRAGPRQLPAWHRRPARRTMIGIQGIISHSLRRLKEGSVMTRIHDSKDSRRL
jgi:hypothetical protein